MAKHAARTHFQKLRYLPKGDWPVVLPAGSGFGESKTSYAAPSEAIRYVAIAAPKRTDAAAISGLSPPPTIPRIRPQTVEKLTKVTPAESHFIATAPCL